MERKNKSPVWRVFIKDAAHKRTICTQCGKEFKYRYTTTNLRDHLKRYHPEWLPDTSGNSTVSDSMIVPAPIVAYPEKTECVEVKDAICVYSNSPEDCENVRKNKSAVWQVFVKDSENKHVTCTLCRKVFKFWNNTTNLRAHLRRTHPDWCPEPRQGFNESTEEIEYENDGEIDRPSSASSSGSDNPPNADTLPNSESYVWRVFVKSEDTKGVFCTLCQKHFSSLNNTWSLIDHLRRLHPDWETSNDLSFKTSDVEDDDVEENRASDGMIKSVFLLNTHTDRKNKSPVWEVFIKDSARKRTICTICKKDFKCWNNTANLLDHLRRIHPDWKPQSGSIDAKSDDGRKRPTIARISNTSSSESPYVKPSLQYLQVSLSSMNPSFEIKAKRVDKLIGEMICRDFQNLCIVEDVGFKKLMEELLPNYNLPSRKMIIKETLPQLYENVSNVIREKLDKCKYVSVSVELWTNQSMEGFMTLTVHYFSNDIYTSSVLQTERINTEHSSEDLASVIHKIFDHWNIFDKITAIVADDDAALKAACNMLNITHIPCIAQLLNNIITEELTGNDDAQQLLQRCLNLVAHFKLNPTSADVLTDIQSQMGHPILNLKQVAPTRWNSALHMAQRLVEMKEPLVTTLNAMTDGPEPLIESEWSSIDDFIAVLKPFELMTSELSADSYCNISKVVPLIRGVQSSLQSVDPVSGLGTAMKKSLLEKLETRFSAYEKYVIPSVATLLDPRFKRAGLGVENTIESTCTFVTEQLSEIKSSSVVDQIPKSQTDKSVVPNSNIWNFLDEKVNELSNQKPAVSSAEIAVSQYLDLPYLKRHDCPFKFWISQSNMEPELSDIAMKFMCIPATSFPADRLYSKYGINMTERRNRMATKHFNTIVFLNKNL